MSIPATHVDYVQADGVRVFYRHASPVGTSAEDDKDDVSVPTVVLLHGFPASSNMFRHLIPLLAARGYRVVAPDLPGFGFTEVPPARQYGYTFDGLATTLAAFVDALQLSGPDGRRRFAAYMFDYGAPTLLRFALRRPDALAAVVTQNGNAYEDGLGAAFWAPLRTYWAQPRTDAGSREALRPALQLEATRWQYEHNAPKIIPPETYHLDQALLDRPGCQDRQLDLFHDYGSNLPLYPRFQAWLRSPEAPPVLAIWGRHDDIFVAAGAEAFRRDVPPDRFALRWLDSGHFALETNEPEVAEAMDAFFRQHKVFASTSGTEHD